MLIELLYTFSPLIFFILIGFSYTRSCKSREIESQRRQTIKRLDDERAKYLFYDN